MNGMISPNTKAILLLTAPLRAGRGASSGDPLTLGEYRRLARALRDGAHEPADLLTMDATEALGAGAALFDATRLQRLIGRGFLLAEAAERWQARGIWVISRADREYPRRFKARLKDDSPPVLYGCGEMTLLETGGLAVVGSRHVDAWLGRYAENVGRLAAEAGRTLVSGGARGIDRAAMNGALTAGGND